MDDLLVWCLDSVDEHLLEYRDEDDGLSLDTVRRLRLCTSAVFVGSVTTGNLVEDWADWRHVAPAFVVHRSRSVVVNITSSRRVAETGTITISSRAADRWPLTRDGKGQHYR